MTGDADLEDDASEGPADIGGEPGAGVDTFRDDEGLANNADSDNLGLEAAVIYDSYKADEFLLQDYFCFMDILKINNLWLAANEGDDDANYRYKEYEVIGSIARAEST